MRPYIYINSRDNVITALTLIEKGSILETEKDAITLLDDIPVGHKAALCDIKEGENVVKYGIEIGHATRDIKKGEWVHTHNIKSNLTGLVGYTYSGCTAPSFPPRHDTFMGYVRKDGRVGTRNELWIVPTVSCVNHTADLLASMARERYKDRCDGIWACPHNTGCSQLDEGAEISHNMLNGIIQHPNAGGVLLVSLGCENANLDTILPTLGDYDEKRIKSMVTQDVEDEIEEGLKLIGDILDEMSNDKREPVGADKLVLGFKCGGSDAFSGITANPLVGRIADRISASGGSGILSEISEIFGAEQFLMNRAENESVYQSLVDLINRFKKYYMDEGLPIYENPSPGNKKGGISTDEEKSMGNIQKSGSGKVSDVLTYGEKVKREGISVLEGPGNDSVSITNILTSGATLLLFTTGRGNPLSTLIPTIKVSSNSSLSERKHSWIDFNAGRILEGVSMDELEEELWQLVLATASGRETKSEKNGFRDVMIFKKGALL